MVGCKKLLAAGNCIVILVLRALKGLTVRNVLDISFYALIGHVKRYSSSVVRGAGAIGTR